MRSLTSTTALAAVGLVVVAPAASCTSELDECDVGAARTVLYSDDADGLPAYAGQALIQANCGAGAFCHSAQAFPTDRFGVPAGLDFDLDLATDETDIERLRHGQRVVYEWRAEIFARVKDGTMPPGDAGADVAALGRRYVDLPSLDGDAGHAILRNWLACRVPVVERTLDDRPEGVEPVGAVVAPRTPDAGGCSEGEMACSGHCLDVLSDPAHCGSCDQACPVGRGCTSGQCEQGCGADLTDCDGACVDTRSDFQNCGDCGTACGGGEVCALGECSSAGCPEGTANCSGSCVDLQTSLLHCGTCDAACTAGQSCVSGACDCGDTASDPLNCGACGSVCPGGTDCVAGACACGGGLTLCGGRCVDTGSDAANCGGCGNVCAAGERCDVGACVACGEGISFAGDVQPIFDSSCAGSRCHSGAQPAGGLSLESGRSWGDLVGVPSNCQPLRVAAGLPDDSYLVDKLTGIGMCRGDQMPLRAAALPAAQIDLIRAWICGGALDN